MSSGSIYKVCRTCPERKSWSGGESKCPNCASRDFSWTYKVTLGKKPNGTPRVMKKGGFDTKADADAALFRVLDRHSVGRTVDPSKVTVREFHDTKWKPSLEARDLAESTMVFYADCARLFLERIGDDLLQELTDDRIDWMLADVRKNGRQRGRGDLDASAPLAGSTVRKVFVSLNTMLEYAIDKNYLAVNPARRVAAPSAKAAKASARAARKTWKAEQVDRFAAWLAEHAPFWFVLWLVAISTGLRRGELGGLRWQDVELERRTLYVRQVVVKIKGGSRIRPAPKTEHGFRAVTFGVTVAAALHQHRKDQLQARLACAADWEDHGLVFARWYPGRHGEPPGQWFHPDTISHELAKLISAARADLAKEGYDLPKIRPLQDMRHTHATILLTEGRHPKVVQQRLGHHSSAFTMDVYQEVTDGLDLAAADVFDAAVFSRPEEPSEEVEE